MRAEREVYITAGKKAYSVRTSLSTEEVDQVRAVMDEVCGVNAEMDQEGILLLGCLRLAHEAAVFECRVRELCDKIADHMKIME
ncbi:MAG: hypothetical protein IJG07_13395 [Prevotella sp.]|nr:hypothetical protein [Prevotella sp.]